MARLAPRSSTVIGMGGKGKLDGYGISKTVGGTKDFLLIVQDTWLGHLERME
jgi:hypothetical protein